MRMLTNVCLTTVGLCLLTVPAMAQTMDASQPLPEPGTLGLLAGGVAAAAIIGRLRKPK